MIMQLVHLTNQPGAHRFKIDLTLAKKTLSSTEDATFFEIARIVNGETKRLVRSTEYAVLEDNLARRTFDESGHYTLAPLKAEVREHLASGNNRGIFSSVMVVMQQNLLSHLTHLKRMYEVMKLIILQQLLFLLIKQEILIQKIITKQDMI